MVLDLILAASPLFLPIIAGLLTVSLSYINKTARNIGLIIIMGAALIINTILLVQVTLGTFVIAEIGAIIVNESGIYISELVLFLSLIAIIYSIRYMSAEKDDTFYFLLISLFAGSIVGLIYSFNLIILYMFLEASTITSSLLVMYGRTKRANRAALIYLLISIMAGFLVLGALFIIFYASGVWNILDPAIQAISIELRTAASVIVFAGFSIKAGMLPLGYIWLPKLYADCPSPISALLSGLLHPITAFTLIRIVGVIGFDIYLIPTLLVVFGIGSMLAGAISALMEFYGYKLGSIKFGKDIKKILAYSTMSEIGIIVMLGGIQGLLGPFAPGAEFAALSTMLLHIYNHGLSKALLFFAVGVIMYYIHARDISGLGALSKPMPITTTGFIIGGLSLGMIPPLFGFLTIIDMVFTVFSLSLNIYIIFTVITIVITLVVYIISFLKIFIKPVAEDVIRDIDIDAAKVTAPPKVRWYEPGPMIFSIILLSILVISLGVLFLTGVLNASVLNLDLIAESVINPGL
jgi:hydrogenase-4 component B